MLEFLFKVDPGALAGARVEFAISWPALAALAAAAMLLAVAASGYLGGYLRRVPGAPGRKQTLLLTLRAALALLAVVALARPQAVVPVAESGGAPVAVLVDASLSMGIADGPGDATRAGHATALLGAADGELTRQLARRFPLRHERFAAGLMAPDSAGEVAVSNPLGALLELAGRERLSGVVLASDGGQLPLPDPEQALARLRGLGVPVHVLGFGASGPSPDVAVAGVSASAAALQGDALDVTVWLRATGFEGERIPVTVRDNGVLIAETEARVSGGRATARVGVTLREPGVRQLEAQALAPAADRLAANNLGRQPVHVRETPARVLHFEGEPRFEVKFLRRAVGGDRAIALSSLVRTGDNRFLRLGVSDASELADGFPASAEELFRYHVLVLGSVEAAAFSDSQLALLEAFVGRRGASVLFLGGRHALAEGGYGQTAVAGLLPLRLGQPAPEFRVAASAVLTRAGIAHPVTRELPALAGRGRALPLPALAVINPLREAKPGASVLLEADDGAAAGPLALLAWHRFGAGRVAVLPARDTWRWRMHADVPPDDRTHEILSRRRLLRWLAREVPEQVEVTVQPAVAAPGQPVTVRARVRDAEWRPLQGAAPSVLVTTPLGDIQPRAMTWAAGDDGLYQARFTAAEIGMHEVRVVAGRDGAAPAGVAALAVDAAGGEYRTAALDESLLRRIAAATGGSYRRADAAQDLVTRVADASPHAQVWRRVSLWDAPALLLVMLALAAAEWWLRRRRRELP